MSATNALMVLAYLRNRFFNILFSLKIHSPLSALALTKYQSLMASPPIQGSNVAHILLLLSERAKPQHHTSL